MSYPVIHKYVMAAIPKEYISLSTIISAISTLLYGLFFKKNSDRLIKYFPLFSLLELFFCAIVFLFVLFTGNIKAYYIFDMGIFCIITRYLLCGTIHIKAMICNGGKRIILDNTINSLGAAATITGACMSMIVHLDLYTMMLLGFLGTVVINISYLYVYLVLTQFKQDIPE